ncbi:hypothetical protein C8R47DRAFT_1159835 [Mycena vitilis]|nr:hypothetical protein C8R47DRAFT_1159835 [Mycena vitilis]
MSVILYRYDASPFSHKIDHVLLLKNIPHEKVNVGRILPRPEITDMLDVKYRRIPVLAIGNDLYCDTGLITSALERGFPASAGYGTLFPNRKGGGRADAGLIQMFTKHWAETVVFFLGVRVLDFASFPPEFVKDRETLLGGHINFEAMAAGRPKSLSALSTHFAVIEDQLSDGREWLFDTELPSLADISVHFVLVWIKHIPAAEPLFEAGAVPKLLKWLARMTAHLEKLREAQASITELSGEDAAARIAGAPSEPYSVVGFDVREGDRLGLKSGDQVAVGRDDSGPEFATAGTLVALNKEEFVIENSKGIRCHFPRIGFVASLVSSAQQTRNSQD